MFYTIYKVTNRLNGKIYIGKHQTRALDDGYMGSGKLIQAAIQKYGLDNFDKEFLFVFETEAEMNAKEAELVTEEFVKEDTNYNLSLGGRGGWDPIKAKTAFLGKSHSEKTIQKISLAVARNIPWNKGIKTGPMMIEERKKRSDKLKGQRKSDTYKKNHSIVMKEYYSKNINNGGWPKGMPRPKIECPHCGKKGSSNNMFRWHFDNCKNKNFDNESYFTLQ